jgi:hypothetical protein
MLAIVVLVASFTAATASLDVEKHL